MIGFNRILGHENIVHSLKNSIIGERVNHAYIFSGEKGIGKHTLAKAFAKTLNCRNGGTEPCGQCISCKTFDTGNNPDIITITHSKRDITVDVIREQIGENIIYRPHSNKYKIFIMPDADKMNVSAQNAFLKTLEEPPEFAIFMLLCENYNKLLATILSRCVTFKLRPVDHNLIEKYLIDNNSLDREKAQMYARYSQGSIGRAVELSNSQDFNEIRDYTLNLARELEKADLIKMYKWAEGLKEYKDEIDTVLEILLLLYRDTLVYIKTGSRRYIIQQDKIDDIINMAQTSNTAQLEKRCDAINDTRMKLLNNGDFQLMTETLFFKIKEK